MNTTPVLDEFDPVTGIARITLNRPDVMNAMNVAMAKAFRDAVARTTSRPDLRCIILAGAGRAFAAGGDIASFTQTQAGPPPAAIVNALLDALHPAILALAACPAPVLAIVQGAAAGAGLSLVLGADLVLAEDQARFLIAYDRVGTSPDCGGTWFLARKVGRTRALEVMLLGQALDAEAARQAGIVSEIVPASGLQARAEALALRIASGPTQAYGRFKRLLADAHAAPLDQHLQAERAAFLACTETTDFDEGVQAFLGKREPRFRGI